MGVPVEMTVDFNLVEMGETPFMEAVMVSNSSNIFFLAPKSLVLISEKSAKDTLANASLRLNSVRLRVFNAARDSTLTSLPDNVLGVIYDFVCSGGAAWCQERPSIPPPQ